MTPDCLFNQCLRYLANYSKCLDLIRTQGMMMPYDIWNLFADSMQLNGRVFDDEMLKIMENHSAKFSKVHLWNCALKENFPILLRQNLYMLDLGSYYEEEYMEENFLIDLNQESLQIFSSGENMANIILTPALYQEKDGTYAFEKWECILKAPNLVCLALWDLICPPNFLTKLVLPLTKLQILDLSGCQSGIRLSCLTEVPHLTSLILYKARLDVEELESVLQLHNLRHLDLAFIRFTEIMNADVFLKQIINNLPHLDYLDISGMDLEASVVDPSCLSIPGLQSRMENPLRFLGLLNCFRYKYEKYNIPAKHIAGDFNCNPEHLLRAGFTNLERWSVLCIVLRLCHNYYHQEQFKELLLEAMTRHARNTGIQSIAIDIMESICGQKWGTKRTRAISATLNAMTKFPTFIDCRLLEALVNTPKYVSLFFERLMTVGFLESPGRYVLRHLFQNSCGSEKQKLINEGIIERLMPNPYDCELDYYNWDIICTLIAENYDALQRFIKANGIKVAYEYFQRRCTFVLVTYNILAQYENFLPLIMKNNLLLKQMEEDFNSYEFQGKFYIACFMARLLVCGWTFTKPREAVLKTLKHFIEKLSLQKLQPISASLLPTLLNLLKAHDVSECQYLAVLGLVNIRDRVKCYGIVKTQGYEEMLRGHIKTSQYSLETKEMAQTILNECEQTSHNIRLYEDIAVKVK